MQLFIIDTPEQLGKEIMLTDSDLVHQISRVLRMQPGDTCYLQWSDGDNILRFQATIKNITKNSVRCTLGEHNVHTVGSTTTRIAIARPNKKDKLELIAQKLTELGINEINFFKSQRSEHRPLNTKQKDRVMRIVKEAAEQSWSWKIPTVNYYENLAEIDQVDEYVFFDLPAEIEDHAFQELEYHQVEAGADRLFCVGPEGGWGDEDYEFFASHNSSILSLGEQVLRMETAAIVVGWIIKS